MNVCFFTESVINTFAFVDLKISEENLSKCKYICIEIMCYGEMNDAI